MPVKGGNAVRANYRKKIEEINSKRVKAAVTKIIVGASGRAKEKTPVEHSKLINGQFHRVEKTSTGWRGTVGYIEDYAGLLNNPVAGSKLDGWQPKPPDKKEGSAWNPNSHQGFLTLAFTSPESKKLIMEILKGIKLK